MNNHEVKTINADTKTVTVTDKQKNETKEYPYDKLILSSGVKPKALPVPGNDLENVFLMRGYDWAKKIKAKLADTSVKKSLLSVLVILGSKQLKPSLKLAKKLFY